MNKIIIEGHLGANVELIQTNGRSVAKLRVATNRTWYKKDQNGNRMVDPQNGQPIKVKDTQWHRVVAFGGQAERCAQYLHSGSRVLVEGRMEYDEFAGQVKYAANKEVVVDGAGNPIQCLRYSSEIVAEPNGITFLDKAPQNNAYPQGQVQAQGPVAGAPANVPVQGQVAATPETVQATFQQPQAQYVQTQPGQAVQPQTNTAPQFVVPNSNMPQGV